MILPVPSAHPCENSFPMKRFENGVPNIPLPDVKINVERKARTGNWEEAVDVNGTIISFITKENCKTSWMTRHKMVQVESVKLLLAYGADPNTENVYGQTPLFYVGEKQPVDHDTPEQRLKIAQMLLDAGADINHCDHSNNQPLWIAVFYLKGER